MSEQKWTPTPWTIGERQDWWDKHPLYKGNQCVIQGLLTLPGSGSTTAETWDVCALDRGEVADPPDDLDEFVVELQKANASRIVSCVNALSPLRPEVDPGEFVAKVKEVLSVLELAPADRIAPEERALASSVLAMFKEPQR